MRRRLFDAPKIWAITICGLAFLLVAMLTPGAQKKSSMLGGAHGILHLANGSPEEGVGVQLISSKTAIRTTVYSGEDGKFEFPVLDAGEYTLRVPSPREFKPYVRESVQISGATQLEDIVVERIAGGKFGYFTLASFSTDRRGMDDEYSGHRRAKSSIQARLRIWLPLLPANHA